MTTNAFSDWADDEFTAVEQQFTTLDEEFDETLDELDELRSRERELAIEYLIDRRTGRLAHVHTKGLWWMGIPELCISPPSSYNVLGPQGRSQRLAVFITVGLLHLGHSLIAGEGFDVPPYLGEFEGRPARLWVGGQEPVEDILAISLGREVDTLLRVHASLWRPFESGDDG